MEKTPKPTSIEESGNFGLIERFIDGTKNVADRRSVIRDLVGKGYVEAVAEMGFPQYLFPVMRLWVDEGPDILSSFSHPEEFDFDKTTALFNLKLYQERMAHLGYKMPRVLVNHYDTVPLKKSVKKPFKFAEFGSDYDLFAFGDEKTGSAIVDQERKARMLALFSQGAEGIVDELTSKLDNDLASAIKRISPADAKRIRFQIKSLLLGRMRDIENILSSELENDLSSMSDLLMRFDGSLMQRVFERNKRLEEGFGFDSRLFSANTDFLGLVKKSIGMIADAKGVGFLKQFIDKEGEGICSLEQSGSRIILTVANGSFAISSNGKTIEIDDEKAFEFIKVSKPLAKLESLALFAGASTFHIGSEYGIRAKFIEKLGLVGEAAKYVEGLRVTEDRKQGNFGILLKGTETFPPKTLAFLVIGQRRLRELMYSQAGRTNEPLKFSMQEFRSYIAQFLVEDALSMKNEGMIGDIEYGLTK